MKSQRNLILTAQTGPGAGSSFVVQEGQSRSFGREPTSSDVAFRADDFMSSKHFQVFNFGDRAELRDLASRNKTWVNNEIVTTSPLQSGDKIRAGKTLFVVEWEIIPEVVPAELVDEPVSAPPASHWPKPVESWGADPSWKQGRDEENSNEWPEGPSEQESWQPFSDIPTQEPFDSKIEESRNDPISAGVVDSKSNESSSIEWFDAPLGGSRPAESHDHGSSSNSEDSDFQPFLEDRLTDESLLEPIESWSTVPSTSESSWLRLVKEIDAGRSGIWDLIELLSSTQSLMVVAHFKKIGQVTPPPFQSTPVFADIPGSALYLPVIVSASQWLKQCDFATTERLARADGLLMVIGRSQTTTLDFLRMLEQRSFEGFSEEKGFLGWCWPSQLSAMIEAAGDRFLSETFGQEVLGVLYRDGTSQKLVTWIVRSLAPLLRKASFD